VVLMQQTGAGDYSRFRAITIDKLGDALEQSLNREPDTRLKARIEGGVLLLESPLAATFGSHLGSCQLCGST
jgi:hypothetical protein